MRHWLEVVEERFLRWVPFGVLVCLGSLSGCIDSPFCEPGALYGPPPCRADQECVEAHGEGWYCDLDHTYDDGCGGETSWPVCARR